MEQQPIEATANEVIRDAKYCFSPENKGCKRCPRFTDKCISVSGAIECQDKMRADIINLAVTQQSELMLERARADKAESTLGVIRTIAPTLFGSKDDQGPKGIEGIE